MAFGVAALAAGKSVFPQVDQALWVIALYTGLAMVFQWMIHGAIWVGERRSLAMGLVDTAFLSYVVYLLGPASSVLPFMYLLIPVVNAASSSTRSRVAMRLAFAGALAYVGLVTVTALGLVPHAPARPDLAASMPPVPQLLASAALVVLSVVVATHIVLRQMTTLDRMNAKLADLSRLDELTGLYNRRHLIEEVRRQFDRLARGGNFSIMMIDLDGFKRVNDRLGHDAGDLLLIDIAGALVGETRSVDLVSRYGGDEFVVLVPDTGLGGAVTVAERIVEAIRKVGRERWASTPVTASVGVALAEPGDDLGTLMRRADSEAYAAKRAGGDAVCVAPTGAAYAVAERESRAEPTRPTVTRRVRPAAK